MRYLTPTLIAAAVIIVPARSQAASKPNTNIRLLLPTVNMAAAKPKPKRPVIRDFVFTKKIDKASPILN